ncbi:MAG: von Willebrand factor type A domain-containing protein [Acidaminococcaceae bacterium]|nr:von Willebrand factor type A domain-containing protein [Acidaminococcaceae bacterium]
MKFKRLINKSKETRRKYEYYLGLGYSEHAAKVLSVVTYGDEKLVFLVKQLGRKNVVEELYAWLHERKEETPGEAIEAFYEEKHPRPEYEEERLLGCSGAGIMPCVSAPVRAASRRVAAKKAAPSLAVKENVVMCCEACEEIPPWMADEVDSELMEALSTDSYEPIEEKDAKNVFTSPTSTFRMTTSNASMGIVFNQIRSGRRVNMDEVRIEEVLNYFDYEAEAPEDAKFAICTELMEKKGNKKILFIDAQAAREKKEHQNIILLLDTSGSMDDDNEVTQEAVATVFSKLKAGDRISLVTYSTKDHTWLKGFEIKDSRSKEELMGIVLGIEITGCTYGSAGIEKAYAIGEKFYKPDWNNQVILITDGDLNFGITDKHGLKGLIEEKKKSNLFLSVIGAGLYNYKDDNLEVLSKHGNGTYCVVNNLDDVDESVNRRFIALTNIVAKDVKAQVEFNPRFVKSYRLLGYENRQLNHEDFKNDKVISEPYGSGGHGIALYELEMNEEESPTASSDLKYQKPVLTNSDELGSVSIRFKEPLSDKSSQIETAVYNTNHSTQNIRLAYFLYCLSEKLRGSDKLDEYDEQFLDVMITSEFYKNFSGANKEKLEMLMDAFKHNAF